MSPTLKLALLPLLFVQAAATRRRTPMLPEPAGPRSGRVGGTGRALRVLIAGDSSAAGVGVAHQRQALSGCLTRALQRRLQRPVRWKLVAHSGLTSAQVLALLQQQRPWPADVALVICGVNDVIERIPPQRAVRDRAALADWLLAQTGARHVAFAPLPPMELFPLLPRPLKTVVGDEAHRHDEALMRWAQTRADVSHAVIDVTVDRQSMAADGFHPGEPAYRVCGEALAAHIANLQIEAGP